MRRRDFSKAIVGLATVWPLAARAQQPTTLPTIGFIGGDAAGWRPWIDAFVLMITVEHAPGGSNAIHRHNAQAFVYVLEGSVVMQLKAGQQVTLTPGQTFYEGPDDVHGVDRNASSTQPAKFLVVLIKDKGAPAVVPVD